MYLILTGCLIIFFANQLTKIDRYKGNNIKNSKPADFEFFIIRLISLLFPDTRHVSEDILQVRVYHRRRRFPICAIRHGIPA